MSSMATKTVTVGSTVGLHARPAALIAQAATSGVTLAMEGKPAVDAGSALMIMTLGATFGDEVIVESEDEAMLATIADMVASNLDG